MKATIDLPEALLEETRNAAERHGWSVKLVFEESLRAFLQNEKLQSAESAFRLNHTVVNGERFPAMSFSQMLDATGPNRFSE